MAPRRDFQRSLKGPAGSGSRGGHWRTIGDPDLATLSWVHWHNNEFLHGFLADAPPVEFEAVYDANISASALMEITA